MLAILSTLVILLVYRSWFLPGILSSGDWPYLFKETIQNFSFVPSSDFLWLAPYYQWTSKIFVGILNFPWAIYERIFWFWAFLIISYFSSKYFSRVILGKSKFNFVTTVIFLTNTYILMITGGGQMGLALGYAIFPFVIGSFIEENLIIFASSLTILLAFDPRVFFISTLALVFYLLLGFKNLKKKLKFVLAFIPAFVINLYWIIPIVFNKKNISVGYFDSSSLNYFSFAHFEDAFSLLHPNWPENLFGKSYFLRPEFLIIPLIAFSGFLLVKKVNKIFAYFGLLGILGAFLAKGTQEPFGFIYSFLFEHLPGFFLFRDPTKFYILIVLSYMVLIPFTIEEFSKKLSNIKYQVLSILFIIFWIFTVRQSLFGQLSGTFKPHGVPNSYFQLKNFLLNDNNYSKVLWVPSRQTFSYYSDIHPFLEASQIFGTVNNNTLSPIFSENQNIQRLEQEKVKYVILDEDTEGNLFTNNRKYSEKVYQSYLASLEASKNLKKASQFGKIVVFELK